MSPEPPAAPENRNAPAPPSPAAAMPGRPWEVYVLLIAIAAFWCVSSVMYLRGLSGDEDSGENIGYMVFWTAVVLLCLWRIWAGGALAIAKLSLLVGVVGLGGLLLSLHEAYTALTAPPDHPIYSTSDAVEALPMIVISAALVAVSQLPRRRRVGEWVEARHRARQAARQNRGQATATSAAADGSTPPSHHPVGKAEAGERGSGA